MGGDGTSWDFMEIYGFLWEIFIFHGSSDITVWVFPISGGNFRKFTRNFAKFDPWRHHFEELTNRRRLEISIPKKLMHPN